MNAKNTIWLILFTGTLSTSSCKKWLDVSPQTQVRERTLLETEQGFKDAMIGVYLYLGGGQVYGQNLTMGFMDVLGQRYAVGSTHSFYRASLYQYADVSPKGNIAAIWSGLYTAIGNIDNLLLQIDDKKSLFTGNNYKIIKGEALALRSFLHFDLIRMFGPAPVVDGNRKSIPYVTGFGRNIYPLLTVNQVIDSCLSDLAVAETLLSVEKGVRNEYNQEPYLSYTRNHLNYWAVKGLQARIYLYRGNKTAALAAAQDVINNGGSLFPFVTSAEASRTSNRDKVYANEQLFSLSVYKINDFVSAYFKTGTVNGTPLFYTTATNLNALYETSSGGSSDIRYNYLFTQYQSGYSTTKYHQDDITQAASTEYLRNLIPMIRLSEVYFIAAECAPTPTEGVGYLNTIRGRRGLANLATNIDAAGLEAQVLREYKKEMYAEGQLFYYFKRKNTNRVDGSSVNMSDATWIFPLPENEVEFGKRF
jgi:hypothetical protein